MGTETPSVRGLTPKQITCLLEPIDQSRVLISQGHSHVPAYDVVAQLTYVFGFEGWDKEILSLDLVSEEHAEHPTTGKDQWTVTYRCLMRLRVRDQHGNVVRSIDDGATGSANKLPLKGDAHDFALKNSISYALKRCAKDLGDQFGLSLYNKGMTDACVVDTLVKPGLTPATGPRQAPNPVSLGNDERSEPATETDTSDSPTAPVAKKAATAPPPPAAPHSSKDAATTRPVKKAAAPPASKLTDATRTSLNDIYGKLEAAKRPGFMAWMKDQGYAFKTLTEEQAVHVTEHLQRELDSAPDEAVAEWDPEELDAMRGALDTMDTADRTQFDAFRAQHQIPEDPARWTPDQVENVEAWFAMGDPIEPEGAPA